MNKEGGASPIEQRRVARYQIFEQMNNRQMNIRSSSYFLLLTKEKQVKDQQYISWAMK